MPEEACICLDGNTATAQAVYKFINFAAVFPITPSSPMAELVEYYAAQGKKNLLGETILVKQAYSEMGAAGTCHGAAVNGSLCATFTCSYGLLLMISNLYHIAGEHLPIVLHIANRSVGINCTSLATDHSDLYSIEGTNMCVMQSSNVQECYDMAICTHATAIKAQCAFVHSFEGYRVSHYLESLKMINDDDDLRKFIDMEALLKWRNRGVSSTDRPFAQNVGLGTEVAMQCLESSKYDFDRVPQVAEEYFDLMFKLTGRRYHCFEYYGHPYAESVFVILGSASSTVQLVVEELAKYGKKVGMIKIRLFRPFSTELFIKALPASAKVVVCLDRAPELVQAGGMIYRDVSVACMKEGRMKQIEKICGGRYSYLGWELMPKDVLAMINVFGNSQYDKMPCEFVVGIIDDLRGKSIPRITPQEAAEFELKMIPDEVSQTLLYGIGSDGTIGAARNAVQILYNTASNIQVYCQFAFDGKKSGGLTVSHIRLYKGDDESIKSRLLHAEYDIQAAQYIGCHCEVYLYRYKNMFSNLKPNGVCVLNVEAEGDLLEYAEKNIPDQMKKDIADRHGKLYLINANKIASQCGIPGRTNNILILFYFKFGMSSLIKFYDAVDDMKNAAKKTYAKRGQAVIDSNIKALDQTVELIDSCKVNYDEKKWSGLNIAIDKNEKLNKWAPKEDRFFKTVVDPVIRRDFAHIGTKYMHEITNGFVPPNYMTFEKQYSAEQVAHWNKYDCIYCSICSSACPHSSIRPFALYEKQARPEGIETLPYTGYPEKQFTIYVSPADCRGCGVCMKACPKKCIEMKPLREELEKHQYNFEWCRDNLYTQEMHDIDGHKVGLKELMMRPYTFEYAGSCPGCPETTYLKLLTYISGEALYVTAAVGCSLVWAHYNLVRPFSTNKDGRGISAISSLFEDGTVFHWGSTVARDNTRGNIIKFLKENVEKITWSDKIKEATQEVINTWDDVKTSYKAVDKLRVAMNLKNFKEGEFNDLNMAGTLTDKQLELSNEDGAHLQKVIVGAAPLTQKSYEDYVKLNQLLFTKHSNWYFAGDGAVFDIDSNGLDHIMGKGDNVNVVVFCNYVFSNTGGQLSKNSFVGQITKNCYMGVDTADKQLGQMFISAYGRNVYVAQCSLGYNRMQYINALREAEAFDGPSIVLCYCPCINHLIKGGLQNVEQQQKQAVECGLWPIYRWNPKAEKGKRLCIDGLKKKDATEFTANEQRFMALKDRNPARFEALQKKLQQNIDDTWDRLENLKNL